MKKCKVDNCDNEALKGRTYCKQHYNEYRRRLRLEKISKGIKCRTTYTKQCIVCGKTYEAFRKNSKYCSLKCWNSIKTSSGYNPYVYDKGNYKNNIHVHRNIAENVLKRKLTYNEVVHHLDCNPANNNLNNLIVISRSKHSSLHNYLNEQRAILQQCNNVNIENCWKTLIVPMTTTWLETTGVNVKKLWEIGQSAAEPLLNEEGSETMHNASQVDDEIVQTTNESAIEI